MHAAEPGLAHYLHLLRRGLWIIVLTIALAMGAAVYESMRQTAVYVSSADVFLSTQNLASTLANVQAPSSDPVRDAATQADLARTPAVATRALGLARLQSRSAGSLLSSSSVSSAANADILTFSVTDHQPRIAERLAEDYAIAYTQYRRQLDTAAIVGARREIEAQLSKLKASGEEHGALYATLSGKDQELRTMQVLQGSNALLVRSAAGAVRNGPKPVRNGALAAVLGLLLGAGLVFLRDALNTRVRTAGEVQRLLDLPQLGRVPEPPRRLRTGSGILMLAEPLSPSAEPFRILATNLDFVNLERNARTIMFTSARRDEGKSTTVANLAVALARGGRRVILVDLDVRKPSLEGLFALGKRPGLTTVVLGNASLDSVLVPVPLLDRAAADDRSTNGSPRGMVEVLPVGPLPPNPAEFVGSHALAALLAELEQRADIVLVDAPPILDLSDAMTLSARVDGLVVVTRLPVAKRSTLLELHRVLATAPTTKLGFVLTGTTAGDTYGTYDYGYGVPGGSRATWETTA
jgi:succinoglycan biosynthesis transport protein ExoP